MGKRDFDKLLIATDGGEPQEAQPGKKVKLHEELSVEDLRKLIAEKAKEAKK